VEPKTSGGARNTSAYPKHLEGREKNGLASWSFVVKSSEGNNIMGAGEKQNEKGWGGCRKFRSGCPNSKGR